MRIGSDQIVLLLAILEEDESWQALYQRLSQVTVSRSRTYSDAHFFADVFALINVDGVECQGWHFARKLITTNQRRGNGARAIANLLEDGCIAFGKLVDTIGVRLTADNSARATP